MKGRLIMVTQIDFESCLSDISDPGVKAELLSLYELYTGIGTFKPNKLNQTPLDGCRKRIVDVLEKLFKMDFSYEYAIPWKFISSPIGEVLFRLYFLDAEKQYTPTEISQLINSTRQYITNEIKYKKLLAHKIGGRWIVKQVDLNDWLARRKK